MRIDPKAWILDAGRSSGRIATTVLVHWRQVKSKFSDCLGLIFLVQALRSVPHLTVTWPNQQHALLPKRSGFFHRGHHVKDNLAAKRPPGPQQAQLRGDNDDVTSEIVPSLVSPSSWADKSRTVAATVDSQSSSERLSPPDDGDRPITTDDWTVVDSGNNTDFHTSPTFPDTATFKRLQVSRDHPYGVPSETEDIPEKGGGEVLCTDGVPSPLSSNRLWRSEVVTDGTTHSKGQVAALSPT